MEHHHSNHGRSSSAGLPLGFVSVWAVLRAVLDDVQCWTIKNNYWIFFWCIRMPVALSMFINFAFFLNIVRVLFLKLTDSILAENRKYRKLGKSTLVLVPLFGVHYGLLWGLSTSNNMHVELAWLLLDQVFSAFQGFFVAVLYCLMNGEVRQELRKLYNRIRNRELLTLNMNHSTQISNTKIYMSRGARVSLPSIHSSETRTTHHSPSPLLPRNNPSASLLSSPVHSAKDGRLHAEMYEMQEELIQLRPLHDEKSCVGPNKSEEEKNSRNSSKNGSPAHINYHLQVANDLSDSGVHSLDESKAEVSIENACNLKNSELSMGTVSKPISENIVSKNGKVSVKKTKLLKFSESTEEMLSRAEEYKQNKVVKETLCVNVKKGLKSQNPQKVESYVTQKNPSYNTKDAETVL
ncbi:unnamed protein product, partial [Meganyctiphanes norvegica]